jgi:two-component system NarL family response regulator
MSVVRMAHDKREGTMDIARKTRLIIVEDDPLLRDNLRLLLGGDPGFNLVGAFNSAEDALSALKESQPQMMLADLGLPGMSGVELIQTVKLRLPNIDIIAHTINEDRDSVFSAIKAGASGYLIKGSTPREIIEALYSLRDGGSPMSPRIARAVVRELQDVSSGSDDTFLLTAKEKAVLSGIQDGLAYKEIGVKLNISSHTVHSHIKKIYEKLQAKNKMEALTNARRKGII